MTSHRGKIVGLPPGRAGLCARRNSVLANSFLALLSGALLLLAGVSASAARNAPFTDPVWGVFDKLIAKSHASMLVAPDVAVSTARAAANIAEQHKSTPRYRSALATALWLEAEGLSRTRHLSSARAAITQASQLVESNNHLSKLHGDLALSRGGIAEASGDLGLALKNYQQAHAIFLRLKIPRWQAVALLELGGLYDKARDYAREIRYYREAAQVYSGDTSITLAATNNLGFAYLQMGRYSQSIPFFQKALGIAESLKSPVLESGILNNIAVSYARLEKLTEAQQAADRSLMLVGHDEASEEKRVALGAEAEIQYRRGNFAAAAADLLRVFRDLNLKTTTPAYRDIHEIAYKVYRTVGNLPLAIAHLEAFKRLDDQGRSLAASANLALLGAQFDFARQDLEIEHLKSAELARDIRLRKSQAEIQAFVFAGIVFAVIVLLGWTAWRHALVSRHRNAIAQKNVDLMRTLTERNTEIERRIDLESHLRLAAQAAQQASRAKSHFLANMSHELRTPLNAIIGFSELMLGGRLKPEKMRDYAADILEGGRHLLAVLNNVLDMARIEAGKVELEDQVVRLGDVINHAISVLGGPSAHAGKDVRSSGEADIHVRVDEVRLRQAVINLVSNAVKFTADGGLIEVRVERVWDGVDVVVQDNGEGIPEDKLPVIMEPFGQAENTYARVHGGVGLGLPIVKSLAELHGGRFTVESERGKGTVARIHLPKDRVVDPENADTASDELVTRATSMA
jgi:signal transduction histidine kinase/tetratricopeptide (TPR) repeat protein